MSALFDIGAEVAAANRMVGIEEQPAGMRDGRAMLTLFVSRFGDRAEFAPVVAAINAYLQGERESA